MAFYTDWDAVFNALTAGTMALFGVWVLTLRPRSRTSVFLGLFAVIHGLRFVVSNLWDFRDLLQYYADQGISRPWQVNVPHLILEAGSAVALFGLAHALLLPEGRSGRLAWRVLVCTVPLFAVATLAVYAGRLWVVLIPIGWLVSWARYMAEFSFYFAFATIPLIFAWLYRRKVGAGAKGARQALTMSVAFVLWPALIGAFGLFSFFGRNEIEWIGVGVFVIVLSIGLLWLANIPLDQQHGKAARNAALLVFGLVAFGAIDMVLLWDMLGYSESRGPFFGLARLATVIILTYAILHDQILGMDVKFRFAISKSTVAAVFVAVFFIGTEAAQQFFGTRFESSYLGIAVSGVLVFAIAPLSRLADQIAEKAVPVAVPGGPAAASSAAVAYKAAVRAAMRDGAVSRREERHLAEVAQALGVGPMQAHEWRDEVEREAGRPDDGGV